MSIFVSIVNVLIDLIVTIAVFILGLLPQSPFAKMDFSQVPEGVGLLLYFVPVAEILADFLALITALALWYGARFLLRHIKMID